MLRFRCRSTAAVLVLAFVLSLAASPLAAAAPVAPTAGSWWAALAAGVDGLFDLFGLDGVLTITAPEGPGLEPDGSSNEVVVGLPGVDDDGSGPSEEDGSDAGAFIDPNGGS